MRPPFESVKKTVHKTEVRREEDLLFVGRREKRGREDLGDEFAILFTFHSGSSRALLGNWTVVSPGTEPISRHPFFPSFAASRKTLSAFIGAWSHSFLTFSLHPTMAARRAFTALPARAFRSITHQCRYNSSSTSAMAYKAIHRRIAPLPTADTRRSIRKFSIESHNAYDTLAQWSAAQAVSSILYETPLPSQTPPKRHILNCLVQNEPGVLSRVSGILAARGLSSG